MPRVEHPAEQPNVQVRAPLVYLEARWEYKHVISDRVHEGALAEEELNGFGAEGWELVGLFADDEKVHYYFKRPAEL
jgi:hypothetical protein